MGVWFTAIGRWTVLTGICAASVCLAADNEAKDGGIRGDLRLPRQWVVFGPVDREAPLPEASALRTVPGQLMLGDRALPAQRIEVTDPFGRIDFVPLFGGGRGNGAHTGKTAYVFIPIEVPKASTITLGMGADWWLQAWLDGEEILSTLPDGNGTWPPSALDHLATIDLSAGQHVLAIRFISGAGSSVLAAAGPNVLRKGKPTVPFPNRLADPMPAGNIVPGSDFEQQPVTDPFVPSGWRLGDGSLAFQVGELQAQTSAPLAGQRSLLVDTLNTKAERRRLWVRLAVDVAQLYEISFKASHIAGDYLSLSVRNECGGAETSFIQAVGAESLREAVKPGQRDRYLGCFFFDTPRPYLVIQTHGPVRAVLDDICIRPVSNEREYDTWREQRVPWNGNAWHDLTEDVVTPHIRWAKPLPGPPLRMLSLMPRWQQRRTVELVQRMDLAPEPIMFDDFRTLGGAYWIVDEAGEPSLYQPQKEGIAKLGQALDCILIAELSPRAIPDALVDAILDRVREGSGLVLTGCYYDQRVRPDRFQEEPWTEVIRPENRISADTDFVAVDPVVGKVSDVAFYQYGHGRIVTWAGFTGSGRAQFEAEMSRTIKAMLWASRRLPPIRIEAVDLPGETAGARQAEVQRNQLPATATLKWKSTAEAPSQVRIRAWRMSQGGGARVAVADRTAACSAGRAEIAIPRLPAGVQHVTFQIVDTGTQAVVFDWLTVALSVTAEPLVEQIRFPPDTPPYYTRGDTLRGTIHMDRPLQDTQTLRLKLIDGDGNLWHDEVLRPSGDTAAFELSLEHALVLAQTLRAELSDGEGLVSATERTVTVVRRDEWYENRFDYQLWQMPRRWLYTHRLANARFRKQGITTNYHGWASEHFRDNNIRHVQTVGHWWRDNSRTPGTYFPGIAMKVTGDKDRAPVREPCLTDPVFREQLHRHIAKNLPRKTLEMAPLSYSIGHEENLRGRGYLPDDSDICFHPTTLAHFRHFLRLEYGTLDALNHSWGTHLMTWEEVAPIVLDQAVKSGQIARWIDHRRHMDRVWTEHLEDMMNIVRQHDPQALGVTDNVRVNAATLDSFSGIDFWLLLNRVASGSGMPNDYLRSFVPAARRRLVVQRSSTWNPGRISPDENVLAQRIGNSAWASLMSGLRGFAYWTHVWAASPGGESNCYQPLAPDLRTLPMARWAGEPVAQIRSGIDRFIFGSTRRNSRIAILYSRASEHAATAWHKLQNDALAHSVHPPERMRAFTGALQALGYQHEVLADAQVADGALQTGGFRLLILPFAQAISPEAAGRIAAFVEERGTVLADIRPAIADQHGALGDQGLLDHVFGVRQEAAWPYSPALGDGAVSTSLGEKAIDIRISNAVVGPNVRSTHATVLGQAGGEDAFFVNTHGSGQAVLWNCAPRMTDDADRRLLDVMCRWAGTKPVFNVYDMAARKNEPVSREATGELPRTSDTPADAEGFLAGTANLGLARPVLADFVNGRIHCFGLWYPQRRGAGSRHLRIVPPVGGVIYDLQTNECLGKRDRFEVHMPLEGRGIYAVLPYRVEKPNLRVDARTTDDGLTRLACSAHMEPAQAATEHHVIRFDLIDPSGNRWENAATMATTQNGIATCELVLPLNAPKGRWTVKCREALSGQHATRTVNY